MGWKDGYVADIEYVHGFYPELCYYFVSISAGLKPVVSIITSKAGLVWGSFRLS